MEYPQYMKQAFGCNQHPTFFCNNLISANVSKKCNPLRKSICQQKGVWIIMVLGTFLLFSLVDISKEISAIRNNFAFYKENCRKFNSDKFLGY